MIRTRKAKLADLPGVVELDLKLYRHHDQYRRKDYGHLPDGELRQVLQKRRRSYIFGRNTNIFVAEDSRQLIGYITVSIRKEPPMFTTKRTGYIGSIYVEERYRGQGVGRLLINEALRWLKQSRVRLVRANIDVLNTTSINLFKKLGFDTYQFVVLKEI